MASPYLDHVAEENREIVENYDVDGVWFDILFHPDGGCHCQWCLADRKKLGLNETMPDIFRHEKIVAKRVEQRLNDVVLTWRPKATTFYKAFRKVEALEPWARGTRGVADIGVISAAAADPDMSYKKMPLTDTGFTNMLVELHQQFDILDFEADLASYKVIIVPDETGQVQRRIPVAQAGSLPVAPSNTARPAHGRAIDYAFGPGGLHRESVFPFLRDGWLRHSEADRW